MHWPEFNRRNKQRSPLLFVLVMGTILGVLFSGNLNGWWAIPLLEDNRARNGVMAVDQTVISTITTAVPVTIPVTLQSQAIVETSSDFTLPGLFDESLTYTLSQYKGQPVILNFWASWCAPCRTEMPAFQRAYETYKGEGLVILAINQTYSDDLESAQQFANDLGLTMPMIRDDSGDVSVKGFKIRGLPTTIFIHPDGKIVATKIGQMSDAQIDEVANQLVAGELNN